MSANKHSVEAPSAPWGWCLGIQSAEVSWRILLLGFGMSPAMTHGGQLFLLCYTRIASLFDNPKLRSAKKTAALLQKGFACTESIG